MEAVKTFFSYLIYYSPLIVIVLVAGMAFHFLYKFIKRKTHESKVSKVRVGDRVKTIRDLEAVVVAVGDDTVDLEYDGHCATYVKEAIQSIL